MKIGLFFGSFNPVHIGHLLIAQHFVTHNIFSKVIFVLSPQNPFKKNSELWDENTRLKLLKKAIKNNPQLEVSDIELSMPKPSYTYDTIIALKRKNPGIQYSIIMGSDNLKGLKKWRNIELLRKEVDFRIFVRNHKDVDDFIRENIFDSKEVNILKDSPLFPISATQIRTYLKEGKSIQYLIPENIRQDILKLK